MPAAISMVLHNDDILGEILLHLGLTTSLVRAALVCPSPSDAAFLRRFCDLHPPPAPPGRLRTCTPQPPGVRADMAASSGTSLEGVSMTALPDSMEWNLYNSCFIPSWADAPPVFTGSTSKSFKFRPGSTDWTATPGCSRTPSAWPSSVLLTWGTKLCLYVPHAPADQFERIGLALMPSLCSLRWGVMPFTLIQRGGRWRPVLYIEEVYNLCDVVISINIFYVSSHIDKLFEK
jgi:hypothetical protein